MRDRWQYYGGSSPVKRVLAKAGLAGIASEVTYMLYPNDVSRASGNRHYLNINGQWTETGSTIDGTMLATGAISGGAGTHTITLPANTVSRVQIFNAVAGNIVAFEIGFNRDLTASEQAAFATTSFLTQLLAGTGLTISDCRVAYGGTGIYVDSVNGDDENSGAITEPLKTLAAAESAYSAGMTVGLARGSSWREALALAGNGGKTFSYGRGKMPVIRGDDIAPNASWSQNSGHVYEYTFTPGIDSTESYISLWENGTRMLRLAYTTNLATTIAAIEATPGTYYVRNMDGLGNTYTVYAHASDSSVITENEKTYEVTSRAFGLTVGNSCTVQGIKAMRTAQKNGSVQVGSSSLVEDCLVEDGVIHHMIVGLGSTVRRCVAWKSDRSNVIGQTTQFVFHGAGGAGTNTVVEDCWAIGNVDPSQTYGDVIGFYSHTSSGNAASITLNRCVCLYNRGFAIGNTTVVTYDGCAVYECYSAFQGQGTTIANGVLNVFDCRVYGHVTLIKPSRCVQNYALTTNIGSKELGRRAGIFMWSSVNGGVFYQAAGTTAQYFGYLAAKRNYVAGSRDEIYGGAGVVVANREKCISEQAQQGWLMPSGTTISASDYNTIYPSTMDQRPNGTTLADFAAYRAAFPALEANSNTNDPGVTDAGGTQEPIITINPASTAAVAGHGPDCASYTLNLDRTAKEAALALL